MTRLLMAVTSIWRFYHRFHYAAVFLAFGFINLFIKRRRVSKVEDDILLSSAVSLAKKIRTRELTSEQVVRTCIKRCLEVNPLLNAIVEDNFERALQEAIKTDEQIESGSAAPYDEAPFFYDEAPFLGVPICMKDHFFVYGTTIYALKFGCSKK
uniref:Uncharacterized protein n=1 Tax=Romanomermis culicivorax TaxID=13658 RepID=A0A915HTW5_ROMCU